MSNNPTNLSNLTLTPIAEVKATTPRRERRRQERFAILPWTWINALAADNANGKAWVVACHIVYEDWRNKGNPIKVPNGMLGRSGVSRFTKIRALNTLERLKLISVERRDRKSPIIRIL